MNGDGRMDRRLNDKIWVWGGPTGKWGGSMDDDCLVKGADYFGARNVMYVYGPHTDAMLSLLKPYNKVVCQIGSNCRTAGAQQEDTPLEAERLSALSLRYPNIVGAIIDDFDVPGGEAFQPERLAGIHAALKKHNPAMRLHVVTYTHNDHSKVGTLLPYIDVVTVWVWTRSYHDRMDADIAQARIDFPGKPIYMGVFINDYGDSCEIPATMPRALHERQLENGRGYISKDLIQGMIILGDREINKHPELSDVTRSYLEKHFT